MAEDIVSDQAFNWDAVMSDFSLTAGDLEEGLLEKLGHALCFVVFISIQDPEPQAWKETEQP